jgi:cytochrome c oxidase assembly protein subunit 15
MIHRYLATAVGVLILVMAIESWRVYFKHRIHRPWWASLTLVWVCVQGAFGALTVTMKLFPAIVTLHLLGGLALLGLLTRQAVSLHVQTGHESTQVQGSTSPASTMTPHFVAPGLAVWALMLLVIQITLGGWVSTNYAVLACTEFPMCQNSWWPEMNFVQGFEVWRELGMTGAGEHVSFAALTAIHMVHRWVALGVFGVLAVLAYIWWRQPQQRLWAQVLIGLMGLQFLTGLSNVVLGWPLISAVLHTGGAAALVVVLVAAMTLQTSKRIL